MTPSAVGDRQIFPRQTKQILIMEESLRPSPDAGSVLLWGEGAESALTGSEAKGVKRAMRTFR